MDHGLLIMERMDRGLLLRVAGSKPLTNWVVAKGRRLGGGSIEVCWKDRKALITELLDVEMLVSRRHIVRRADCGSVIANHLNPKRSGQKSFSSVLVSRSFAITL
jgi:hypothetical protein